MADISKEMAVQLAEAIIGREKANGILVSQWLEYAQVAFKLGRNAGLDEAKQKCKQLEVAIDGAGNTYYRPADARQCVAAIESLKDNSL